MEVYMYNAATTRAYPEVVQLMNKIMEEDYGNPSSLHMKGVEAERYIRRAREILAGILKVEEKELIFTSGGTESNNLAIIGGALANQRAGKHLVTTRIGSGCGSIIHINFHIKFSPLPVQTSKWRALSVRPFLSAEFCVQG